MITSAFLLAVLPNVAPLPTPGDTTHYVVLNHGRRAGDMRVTARGDTIVVRFVYQDRQRGPRLETSYRLDASGAMTFLESRGVTADMQPAQVNERFAVSGAQATWGAGPDTGRAPTNGAPFYRPLGSTPYDDALLARFLLARPNATARLLPAGDVRATVEKDTTVMVGGRAERLRLVAIHGLGLSPSMVWIDDRGALFSTGASGWFTTIPEQAIPLLPRLREIEMAYEARRSAQAAQRLAPSPSPAIVIRNGDVFDAERGVLRPHTSVLVQGDRIVAVGPADSVRTPPGATVIDATGKTVLPGMWDMHVHVGLGEADGPMWLAAGVTTARDLASDIDAAVSWRARAQAGTLLSPRLILGGFIEGPGFWAGPSEALARTEDEARRWVARYDSLGYKQIKLYNLVHPDLVPTIAAETRRRGMRLSGHIPRGLTIEAAVQLGYDEIQHAAFLMSTFYQDSLYVPRMRAYSQVASAVAPTFDVDAPQVTRLLSFLRERGTVIDGTFNIWHDRLPSPDGLDPIFAQTLSWLPPPLRRQLTPSNVMSPQDAARVRSASATYRRLLKRAFDAGVTIVPGTDNLAGLSYHGELEVYERAGIPAASVLQIATIIPARVMKEDKDYGSIAPGKVADLVIVNGRPLDSIRELRKVESVMRAGRVYAARALYETAGVKIP